MPRDLLARLGGVLDREKGKRSKRKRDAHASRKEKRRELRKEKKRKRLSHQMKKMSKKRTVAKDRKPTEKRSERKRGPPPSARLAPAIEEEEEEKEQPEDQEIDYLERKLGLRGKKSGGKKGRKENWKRLAKEWKRDGFGDDFGEFVSGLDGLHERLRDHDRETRENDRSVATVVDHDDEGTSTSESDQEENTSTSESDQEEEEEISAKAPLSSTIDVECPEDQEIDYLERKLGLRGQKAGGAKGKKDNWKRLTKEWKRDGFGDDFGEFMIDLDGLRERLVEDDRRQENASFSSSSSESDDNSAAETIRPKETDSETVTIPSQRDIDLYGRDARSASPRTVVQKYVPPRLRISKEAAESGGDADRIRALQRRVQGQLNRLSETNIEPIVGIFRSCYKTYPRVQVSAVIASKILQSCAGQIRVNVPLMRAYAAVVAALHISEGPEVGAYFLEDMARRYEDRRLAAASDDDDRTAKFEAANILLVLVALFQYSIVHHTLIIAIALRLVENLAPPAHLELLLQLLMHCGFALRKEEPGSLLKIVKGTHRQAELHREDWTRAGHEQRVQFMLDTVGDLSSNRQRDAQKQLQEGGRRLRVWVQRQKQRDQRAHPTLRVTWKDLMEAGHRGRWWIAGSAWTGRDRDEEDDGSGARRRDDAEDADGTTHAVTRNASSAMLALASKHRMNTETRKAIFCVLMSSSDYLEAFERLLKLGLKGSQRREILRVLMHCCGLSRRYNPYFGLVAKQECTYDHRAKFTLQLCFWDAIKQFGDATVEGPTKRPKTVNKARRKLSNLAQLLADLTRDFHLSLGVLKIVDVLELPPDTIFFLRTFFSVLLRTAEPKKLEAVFRRIGATKDCSALLHSVSIFFKSHLADLSKDSTLADRVGIAKMALRDVAIVANAQSRVS